MDALSKSSVALEAAKTPEQKLAEALEMMDWGIRIQRRNLVERHPSASEAEIDAMMTAWLCRND